MGPNQSWPAVLAGCAAHSLAQQALEIIPLRHRTVDQVLPALQPLVEPGGALTPGSPDSSSADQPGEPGRDQARAGGDRPAAAAPAGLGALR